MKNNNKKEELINEDSEEIIIQYKIDDIEYSKDIMIFGDNFVKNNKDKCKIIINENEFELASLININKNQLNNNILEFKLKGIKQITNMEDIFSSCILLSMLDNSK